MWVSSSPSGSAPPEHGAGGGAHLGVCPQGGSGPGQKGHLHTLLRQRPGPTVSLSSRPEGNGL